MKIYTKGGWMSISFPNFQNFSEAEADTSRFLLDETGRLTGSLIAIKNSHGKIPKFVEPTYEVQHAVSWNTHVDFHSKAVVANEFFKGEYESLKKSTMLSRHRELETALEFHEKQSHSGSLNPLEEWDFPRLPEIESAQPIVDFKQSQSKLLKERAENLAPIRREFIHAHAAEIKAARASFRSDMGSVVGAQLLNQAIDYFAPKASVSWKTAVVDTAAPIAAIMLRIPSAGAYAPLIKVGAIVASHAFCHFKFDE